MASSRVLLSTLSLPCRICGANRRGGAGREKETSESSRWRSGGDERQGSLRDTNTYVLAHLDGEVATDGAREGLERVGGADHAASLRYNIETLPAHGDDRRGADEGNEVREEGALFEICVMVLREVLGNRHHLEADELVACARRAIEGQGQRDRGEKRQSALSHSPANARERA